jgi:mitotic spindle assembly checkpoint protein MAD2
MTFALYSILFQRGIYPCESFEARKKYGLSMMVTTDVGLIKYLNNVLQQMSGG